ncbi:MAG: M81 family metallopeptidase, partial [Candidatus Poribacteria bacterium]|nr:M81 family metallopeptidase [Candidatus Poribacteria bacterium]
MRIGVAQFFHESNSFCPSMTTEEHFRADAYLTGDNLFDRWRDTDSEIAGILDVAGEDLDIELVPVIGAWSWPSGPVTDVVYVKVARAIISACLEDRLDGLLLCLHGAAVTETHLDAEGDLLDAIRHRVGRDFPIVATLDFHANVSPRMVELLDGFVGYKTYPHVDYRERGQDACRMIASIAREEIAPTIGYSHPPLLFVPQRQWTAYDPMLPIMQRAHEIEQHDDRVLVANVFGGFCYSDTPYAGFSTSVITNNNPDLAQYYADELAQMAWDNRQKFVPELLYVTDAVTQAVKASDGLTVLVDIGDNIGGGTPGDGTGALQAVLASGLPRCVAVINDPEAALECHRAGAGARLNLSIGGKVDHFHGETVSVSAQGVGLSDGIFQLEDPHSHLASIAGTRIDMGASATV